MFYNELFALLVEAYFEMLISSYLQIRAPLRTANGEVTSIGFGYITIFFIMVFLPIAMIWLLFQPRSNLEDKKFQESWIDLYRGMKTHSKWQSAYFLVFILRRIIYVAIAFEIFSDDYSQIMTMSFLNMAWMLYLGGSWPHQARKSNIIDMINEAFIIVIFLHLLMFTDWVPDQDMQYLMGWSCNGFLCLMIAFNLFFVFQTGGY